VTFERYAIDRRFDARVEQFDEQHEQYRSREQHALGGAHNDHRGDRQQQDSKAHFLAKRAFPAPCRDDARP